MSPATHPLTALPVSAVVPTRHRPQALSRTLMSLLAQGILPAELIVVDASDDEATCLALDAFGAQVAGVCQVRCLKAQVCGAAAQRNQGVTAATQPVIWFFDDDILFEPECVSRLWAALNSSPELGGVNAMITNQSYHPPGLISRVMFRLIGGKGPGYAGRVIGPAVNFLPEDRADLPEVVPVEWLNTTCTFYRREALPDPPFSSQFTGYSMMEDLTLSLIVSRQWRLANARTARIYHDSQPGSHKADAREMAAMETVNRHYVMTGILGRKGLLDYLRLILWQLFSLLSSLRTLDGWRSLPAQVRGRWDGWKIICNSPSPNV